MGTFIWIFIFWLNDRSIDWLVVNKLNKRHIFDTAVVSAFSVNAYITGFVDGFDSVLK